MIHWTTVVLAAVLAFRVVREYRQGRHIVSCGPEAGRIQYGEPPAGATKGPTTTIICYLLTRVAGYCALKSLVALTT